MKGRCDMFTTSTNMLLEKSYKYSQQSCTLIKTWFYSCEQKHLTENREYEDRLIT